MKLSKATILNSRIIGLFLLPFVLLLWAAIILFHAVTFPVRVLVALVTGKKVDHVARFFDSVDYYSMVRWGK